VPPDPYERLQAARTAVKALKDERSMLAVRLAELAKGSDEEALVEASMRLDALPRELLRAELKLARADRQAARATLQAAEASLARALANVRDVNPLPDATVKEKLERAAEAEDDADEAEGDEAEGDEAEGDEAEGAGDGAGPPTVEFGALPRQVVVGRRLRIGFRVTNGVRETVRIESARSNALTWELRVRTGRGAVEWVPRQAGRARLRIVVYGADGRTLEAAANLTVRERRSPSGGSRAP
jgi:hypothetical protein